MPTPDTYPDDWRAHAKATIEREQAKPKPRLPDCDYCLEGLPITEIGEDHGVLFAIHLRVDPEGIDGDQRIPCLDPVRALSQ